MTGIKRDDLHRTVSFKIAKDTLRVLLYGWEFSLNTSFVDECLVVINDPSAEFPYTPKTELYARESTSRGTKVVLYKDGMFFRLKEEHVGYHLPTDKLKLIRDLMSISNDYNSVTKIGVKNENTLHK